MAQTNYTPIQIYYSSTASAVPVNTNLLNGELAINITDGKLYYKDNSGTVQVIATKGAGTIGGLTTQVQYNLSGALAGSANLTFNGTTLTAKTLNLTNALGTIYGGTGLTSYTTGDLLYSSASNTLAKLAIGTANYILTVNSGGTNVQWSAPSSISVSTATNLAGGVAGSVPYQSGASTTTFLGIGAADRVMTSSGSAPQWVTALTGLTGISSSSITNTGLTSGRVVYSSTGGLQTNSANLTFDGTTLTTTGVSNTGTSTIVKLLTVGNTSFNGTTVFAAATPAKLYMGTGTVTDVTSAVSATNATGAIASLAITPIAATNTGVTYTNASTLYIAGAPSAGTNITITNPYALYVAGGASYLGGNTSVTGTLSASDGTNGNIKAYVDGTAGYLQSLNQAANAYRPLLLMGSTVSLANNGVTNAILDTTGYFGVGTLTPSTFVHALGGTASAANVINWNARLSTVATGSSAFGNVGTGIYFDSYTNSDTQPIAGVSSYLQSGGSGGAATNFSGGITFWVKNGGNASLSRAATINQDGYFGLGVTTVGLPFDVAKTGVQIGSTTGYTIGRFREGVPNKGVTLGYDSGSQTGIVLAETTAASSNLAFWTYQAGVTGWAERVRIDSGGYMLIGHTTNTNNARIQTRSVYGTGTYYNGVTTLPSDGGNGGLTIGSSTNDDSVIASGAIYYSTGSGQYYPYGTTASVQTMANGNFAWYSNTGLTAGTLYTPTAKMNLNASGNLMVGTGPNNGQYYNIGVYKPSVPVALLINADNGYNTYINYSVYGGGISFGRDGSGGGFRWNSANDFNGTDWATLNSNGLYLSGNILPAAQTSVTVSTNAWSAGNWYQVVAPGVLANQASYWVTYRWDHTGGYPYIMAGAFMITVVNTNGTGVDNTFTPLGTSHVGGGAYFNVRTVAGLAATNGIEFNPTAIVAGSLTIRFYRFT